MVRLTITLTALPGESWRLLEALNSLTIPTRQGHGCFGSRLSVSSEAGDPSCIQYVEDWSSEEDLREQVGLDRFPRLLAVMEEALVPPQIICSICPGARGDSTTFWEMRREGTRRPGRRSNAEDSETR